MALRNDNITVTLVKNTIGEDTNSVGNLCISPNVNKHSRYKPVDGTWPGDTLGFSIPYTDNAPTIDLLDTVWTYVPPKGGAASPYRLGDFRGYDHDIQPTNANAIGISLLYDPAIGQDLKVSFSFGSDLAPTLASPHFMPLFANAYMGVSVYVGNQINYVDHKWTQCGELKIGSNSGELITIPYANLNFTDGQFIKIIPFITQYRFNASAEEAHNGRKWSLNNTGVNSNVIVKSVGTVSEYPYVINNYVVEKLGSSGIRINALAISQRTQDYKENGLYIGYAIFDDVDGLGAVLFDNRSNPVDRVPEFTVPALGRIDIPIKALGWGSQYPTKKSIRFQYMSLQSGAVYNEQIYNL